MYPTTEVRLKALIERHNERAQHRRAVGAALAANPARIGRWITRPSERATPTQPAEAAARSS